MKASKPVIVGVAGAALVLGGWYKVVWTGQDTAIAAANTKRATAEAATKKTKLDANRLATLKTDPVRAQLEKKLDTAVPAEAGLPEYMRWIRATAEAHNLTVPTISHATPAAAGSADPAAGAAAPDGQLFQVALAIQASGSYTDVLDFVHALETADRLVILDTLSLTPGGDANAVPTDTASSVAAPQGVTASITARMFSRHGIASSAATTVPGAPAAPASPSDTAAASAPSSTAPAGE